jgi:acetyl-CoA acetyltransferase family protein
MTDNDVFIVDAVRTPFARGVKGQLVATRLDEVAATVVQQLLERNGEIDPREVEDFLVGNVRGGGELSGMVSANIARLAGLLPETASVTVNRQCGSSMQALHAGARALMTGAGEVCIVAGVERMNFNNVPPAPADTPLTRIPERVKALSHDQRRPDPNHDSYFTVAFPSWVLDAPANPSMVQTAQNVADVWNLDRRELDDFSLQSHVRAVDAYAAGRYHSHVIPIVSQAPSFDAAGGVTITEGGPSVTFERDECIRQSTPEQLAALKPLAGVKSYHGRDVVVTAGNSCPMNDGAAAALLVSGRRAAALQIKPLARIVSMAVSGVKPQLMGVGTIPASVKALQRVGLQIKDIGLAEVNEAFASQAVVTIKELGLDMAATNVNGGAIAIGHPLGASGIRLLASLCHEMRRRGNVRYGLATMCIGAGMGIATVVEAIE